MASSTSFPSPAATLPTLPSAAYLPPSSSSSSAPDRFDYSPSTRSLSLSGPTPCPSRPLSFIEPDSYDSDASAPTRVGSRAPSFVGEKKEKGEEEDVEKGEEKEAVREEDEYPEGGLRAWLAVLGSTLVLLSTFGLSNSYSVFLSYYSTHLLSTYTSFSLSWIGSSHLFITFSCAFFAGILFDKGWFQYQLALGSVGWVAGVFCLSVSKTYWQIFLSQAVLMGLSLGLMFSPALSVLGTYFKRQRAFVVGIAASGTAIGAVVFPIMLGRVFESKGFAEGVRAAGYLMLALLVIANLITRPRPMAAAPPSPSPSSSSSTLVKKPALLPVLRKIARDKAAWFVCGGVFCIYTCCFIPLFYIVSFAKHYNGSDSVLSQYSLSIINAVAFLSRILSGLLADRLGTFNLALPLGFAVSILTFGMIGCTTPGPLVAFLVLFGAAQGGWISVSATCFMGLAESPSEIGLRGGIGFFFVALAVLIGSPIAGALLNVTGGSYTAALCFGGAMAAVGCGFLAVGRGMVVRKKGTRRV
ncbi:hypothetical protein JCM8547_007368 [Rhodosporidiobolus lusitaniae]